MTAGVGENLQNSTLKKLDLNKHKLYLHLQERTPARWVP